MSYLELGRRLLQRRGRQPGPSLVAIVLRARRVVGVGYNSYVKTHPRQRALAEKVGEPHRVYLHAEVAALRRAPRNADTLVVVRINKAGGLCNAKPCPCCQLACDVFGIKTIIHS